MNMSTYDVCGNDVVFMWCIYSAFCLTGSSNCKRISNAIRLLSSSATLCALEVASRCGIAVVSMIVRC